MMYLSHCRTKPTAFNPLYLTILQTQQQPLALYCQNFGEVHHWSRDIQAISNHWTIPLTRITVEILSLKNFGVITLTLWGHWSRDHLNLQYMVAWFPIGGQFEPTTITLEKWEVLNTSKSLGPWPCTYGVTRFYCLLDSQYTVSYRRPTETFFYFARLLTY